MKTLKINVVALLSLVFFASCEQNEVLPVSNSYSTNSGNSYSTLSETKQKGDYTENKNVNEDLKSAGTIQSDISIKIIEKIAE